MAMNRLLSDLAEDVPRVLGNVPLLLTWGVNDLAFPPHLIDRFRAGDMNDQHRGVGNFGKRRRTVRRFALNGTRSATSAL